MPKSKVIDCLAKQRQKELYVRIIEKKILVPSIYLIEIGAPRVAKSCLPGQFVIIKIDEKGERIFLKFVTIIQLKK